MPTEIFTVSEINGLIRDVVSSGFPSSLWVCGEIQNLDRYKSKAHLFFELVEKDTKAGEIKAKLGVTIWAGVRPKIETLLKKAENAFELKDGIEVKFSGKVDFYPPYGTLRFVIDNIDPVYTLGKIAQDRQKLIAELTQAGVLAKNKEKELPALPLRLGLISAFDSAAYNDFLDELKKSGFAFNVSFFNAVMQGKNCEASICAGLKLLGKTADLDLLVITRGGGSIAELSAFDSKAIALAVAASSCPVITGIGHEINTSVTDLAAHTFAKTPTAVAQFLVMRVRAAVDALDASQAALVDQTQEILRAQEIRLKNNALKLRELTRILLKSHQETHVRFYQQLKQVPLRSCLSARRELTLQLERIRRSVQSRFKAARTTNESSEKLIYMASPIRILKRGFSITRLASGKLVRQSTDVNGGDELITELPDAKITSIAK